LKKLWGKEDNNVSREDKFLRDYILQREWKNEGDRIEKEIDEEDERREDEMDDYERELNFRFEEDGGKEIQTHSRTVDDTMRKKESKRSTQRQAKKTREQE